MPSSSNAPVFLVSPPRRDWTIRGKANVFAQATDTPPSAEAARADWLTVCDAIEAAGGVCAVIDNDSDDSDATLTGLPYCAEAGLCGKDGGEPVFVLPQLTPPHRRAEPSVIAPAVARLGVRTVRLPDGMAFEGQGDVIAVGDKLVCTAGVGTWARTKVEAYPAYRRYLTQPSLLLSFHADPWFHGNTFLGAYTNNGDVVIVVCFAALRNDGPSRLRAFVDGATYVELTAEQTLSYATNALQVGTTVLAPAGVPDVVVDAWRSLGLSVQLLELPALFRKGGGAAVCLTNRLDGVRASQVPDDMRLSSWKERQ